jgi:hypothetical protein
MKNKKIIHTLLASALSLTLLSASALPASAKFTSSSGMISGTNVAATLSMTNSSTTATVNSGFAAAEHSVTIVYSYYYTGKDGTVQKKVRRQRKTVRGSNAQTTSIAASVSSSGRNPKAIRACCAYSVTYDRYHWSGILIL